MDWPDSLVSVSGAPRCGTSSISHYLSEHPDIAFSRIKEPHYFTRNDFSGLDDQQLRETVATDLMPRFFYPLAKPHAKMLGEGSVSHLYAPEATRQILRVWPNARFVIAVRNPLAMLPSLHERLLFQGDETEEDFTRAWQLIAKRKQGAAIPRTCIDPRLLHYDDIGSLGRHLQRFFEVIGRERCHVVVFDDLIADTRRVYREILQFLGLPDDGRQEFQPVRSALRYRSATLQRLLKRPPRWLFKMLAGEKTRWRVQIPDPRDVTGKPLKAALFNARKKLIELNSRPGHRHTLDAQTRCEIRDFFAADVALLGRLLDRDLSHWLAADDTRRAA